MSGWDILIGFLMGGGLAAMVVSRMALHRENELRDLLAETAARLSRHGDILDQWVCEKVSDYFDKNVQG